MVRILFPPPATLSRRRAQIWWETFAFAILASQSAIKELQHGGQHLIANPDDALDQKTGHDRELVPIVSASRRSRSGVLPPRTTLRRHCSVILPLLMTAFAARTRPGRGPQSSFKEAAVSRRLPFAARLRQSLRREEGQSQRHDGDRQSPQHPDHRTVPRSSRHLLHDDLDAALDAGDVGPQPIGLARGRRVFVPRTGGVPGGGRSMVGCGLVPFAGLRANSRCRPKTVALDACVARPAVPQSGPRFGSK
jgi:hypothetical protein